MQTIINDYFRAFRLSNLKKSMENMGWWMYLYMGFVLPVQLFSDSSASILTYMMLSLPFLYCCLSGTIHTIKPPKILFLCPVSERERKEYILHFLLFKTGVIFCLGLIGVIILLVCQLIDPVSAFTSLGNIFILSVLTNGIFTKSTATAKTNTLSANKYAGIQLAGNILAALSIFGIACMLRWEGPVAGWVKWIFVMVLILIELPILIVYLLRNKYTLNDYLIYERCYL